MADQNTRAGSMPAEREPRFTEWSRIFLAELSATSNVTASAKAAGINTSRAYDMRRKNPEFNRQWQVALCEGYDHLEMEVLYRLRTGEIKPARDAKKGVRIFDNATSLRLLAAHRESAMRARAVQDNRDSEAIVASINTKLERMRQRRLAAERKKAQAQSCAGQSGDGER